MLSPLTSCSNHPGNLPSATLEEIVAFIAAKKSVNADEYRPKIATKLDAHGAAGGWCKIVDEQTGTTRCRCCVVWVAGGARCHICHLLPLPPLTVILLFKFYDYDGGKTSLPPPLGLSQVPVDKWYRW